MGSPEPGQAAPTEPVSAEADPVRPPRGWFSPAVALPKGEKLLLLHKPAMIWIVLRTPRRIVALALVLLVLVVWGGLLGRGVWGYGAEAVGFTVLFLALQLTWNVLNYEARWYAVTEHRLMAIGGVLGRYSTEIPLGSVRAIVVARPWLERVLGVGSVGFGSAATGGLEVLWVAVAGADGVADRVRTQIAGPPVVKATRQRATKKPATKKTAKKATTKKATTKKPATKKPTTKKTAAKKTATKKTATKKPAAKPAAKKTTPKPAPKNPSKDDADA